VLVFGEPCHRLVLVLRALLRSESTQTSTTDKLYGAKSTKTWFNDHGIPVLDWPANSYLNPMLESMGLCQERDEGHAEELKHPTALIAFSLRLETSTQDMIRLFRGPTFLYLKSFFFFLIDFMLYSNFLRLWIWGVHKL